MDENAVVKECGVSRSGIQDVEGAAFDPVGASGGHDCGNEEVVRERVIGDVVPVEVAGGGVDHAGIHRTVVVQIDFHVEGGENSLWGDPFAGGRQSEEDSCRGDVPARRVGGGSVGQQVGRPVREGQIARGADPTQLEDPD